MATKIEPYAQGLEASTAEKNASCNPYAENTAAHQEWLTGWTEGEVAWSELCDRKVDAGRPNPDTGTNDNGGDADWSGPHDHEARVESARAQA